VADALKGIRFFYSHTVPRDREIFQKMRIPKDETLPDVLTIDEVHAVIRAVQTQRNAVYFWTVYSLGLRLNEGLVPHRVPDFVLLLLVRWKSVVLIQSC